MTARVDFTSQAFFRDPAAGIEGLRALGPVVATRFPIVGKVWITTTYESTARVLKDSETFTLRKEGGGLAGLRWWMPAFVSALANNMLTMDEPDHTRLAGDRRRSLPPPGGPRHGAADSCHRRPSCRRVVR